MTDGNDEHILASDDSRAFNNQVQGLVGGILTDKGLGRFMLVDLESLVHTLKNVHQEHLDRTDKEAGSSLLAFFERHEAENSIHAYEDNDIGTEVPYRFLLPTLEAILNREINDRHERRAMSDTVDPTATQLAAVPGTSHEIS